MPDFIERTLYKMELDDSGYIRGVDRMATNTARFAQIQEEANKKLRETQTTLRVNQTALDDTTTRLTRYRIELQNATGRNTGVQKQYEQQIQKLEAEHDKLTKTVNENKKAYEEAAQAATRFASAAASQGTRQPAPLVGGGVSPIIQPQAPQIGQIVPAGVSQELRTLLEQIRAIRSEDISTVFDVAAGEMDAFKAAIEEAEHALESMVGTEKEFNEEFKNLSIIVSEGKAIIEEFDKSTAEAARSSLGYRQQITLLHKELSVLKQAGKEETEEYKQKEVALIRLKRAQQDQLQVIRILASETKVLDFGRAAITTATSAFQAYTSVAILAGGASEELQKKTFQLFAAMQLITSLEQLHNQLKKTGIIQTLGLAGAQRIYTAAIGATTGAIKTFRAALVSTGIGVVIVGIGLLINKLIELKEANKDASEAAKTLREVNEAAAQSVAAEAAKLIVFKEKLNDANIPAKERLRVAKEYNKLADEQNKIDTKQINNLQIINEKIDAQNKLILQRATALAATNVLTEKVQVFIEKQLEVDTLAQKTGLPAETLVIEQANFESRLLALRNEQASKNRTRTFKEIGEDQEKIQKEQAEFFKNLTEREIRFLTNTVEERNKAKKVVDETLKLLGPLIKAPTTVFKGEVEKVTNEFEREYRRLINRIAQLGAEALEGAEKLKLEFRLKFEAEQQRIADLFKDKKVTATQAKILVDLAARINEEELNRALDEFNKIVIEKREKLNAELRAIQLRNTQDTLNLLQDEYDRRAALIEFNEKLELEQVKKATDERLKELAAIKPEAVIAPDIRVPIAEIDPERRAQEQKERDQRLLEHQQYEVEKNRIIQLGEDQTTNIRLRAARERQQLALDTFDQVFKNIDKAFLDLQLVGERTELAETQDLVARFRSGEIKYEEFRKRLSAIQKKFDAQDKQATIDKLEAEIAALQRKININLGITEKEYDDLIALIKQKEIELAAARKGQAVASTGDDKKPTGVPPEAQRIIDYANAIGQLAESVTRFWQEANQAEQEALDRSISIQEQRVEAAQRIAARGNAAYLKMEEDRLNQLRVAKENAARRELGINAAVQASQLMVGITGAITRIATVPFGAETIADIAIIIGALATGFALVRSLQNNQPKFATGEKYIRRTKEPAGVDTIPAWLTEGEAVISKDKNKEYHPVIRAIHDGTVPAPYLNKQVERYHDYKHETNNYINRVEKYHTIKPFPSINYERIKSTTETKTSVDGKLSVLLSEQNKKIDENNSLQRETLIAMKHMSVDARIDKDGVAIAVNEYMKQMEINKFL